MQNLHVTNRERLFANLSIPNKIITFGELVKYIEIKQLKKVANFIALKNEILSHLTIDIIFSIGLAIVRQDNIDALKFLIEDCGFKAVVSTFDESKISLLHEACTYGSENCIRYLLSQGASPNLQDSDDQTPLHRIVQCPRANQLIPLFKSYKVNANLRTKDGFAPIHFAAVLDKLPCVRELKSLGANLQLKVEGETYLDLHKRKMSGEIEIGFPELGNSINLQDKTNAQFYFATILPKCNQQIFQDVVKIKLEQNAISETDGQFIIVAHILGTSSQPTNVIKFLNKHLNNHKFSLSTVLSMVYKACALFTWDNDAKSVKALCDFTSELLQTNNLPEANEENKAEHYNSLAGFLNKCGYFADACDMASRALSVLEPLASNNQRAFTLYNLALSQRNRMMHLESDENFQKAFELDKTDSDIFTAYHRSLMRKNELERADEICDLTSCHKQAAVAKLYRKVVKNKLAPQELIAAIPLSVNEEEAIYNADAISSAFMEYGDLELALNFAKQSFNHGVAGSKHNLFNDNAYLVYKYLAYHIECGKFNDALIILEESTTMYPMEVAANYYVKSLAVTIYLENNLPEKAELLLQELAGLPTVDLQLLKKLYLSYAMSLVLNSNLDKASTYFDLALSVDPNDKLIPLYKSLLVILKNRKIDAQMAEESAKQSEPVAEFLAANSTDPEYAEDEDDDLSPNYDPKLIHTYFQDQKRKSILEVNHKVIRLFEPENSWLVNGVLYNQEKPINSAFYHDHYALIHPNLSLDSLMRERFEQALEKGICKRENKQNGVKVLNNRIIELKIADDCRLFTTTKYKNSQGNYLILFDEIGNHTSIKKLLRNAAPIAIVETPNLLVRNDGKQDETVFESDSDDDSSPESSVAFQR